MGQTRLESGQTVPIDDLAEFIVKHGGVDQTATAAMSGVPLPGNQGPSLVEQHLAALGQELPLAKQDIGSLVTAKPAQVAANNFKGNRLG